MINIVCLKWGNKYGPEYVNRLKRAVARHTTRPFRFWCFTEDTAGIDVDITCLPLTNHAVLDSWWNKIELFSDTNGLPLGEVVFYIDLDTLIVNSLDQLLDIASNAKGLIMLEDFYYGIAKSAGRAGSGLMAWKHGSQSHIWEKFVQEPVAAVASVSPHGDQAWIAKCSNAVQYWQDLAPEQVVSFKMHCQRGIPKNASVICYHGVPSIPDSVTFNGRVWKFDITPQPWVLEHWKD